MFLYSYFGPSTASRSLPVTPGSCDLGFCGLDFDVEEFEGWVICSISYDLENGGNRYYCSESVRIPVSSIFVN